MVEIDLPGVFEEEEAIEKAWSEFGAALSEHRMSLFNMFDENGKGL